MRLLLALALVAVSAVYGLSDSEQLIACSSFTNNCDACISFSGGDFQCVLCDGGLNFSPCVPDTTAGHLQCTKSGTLAIEPDTGLRFCISYLEGVDCDQYLSLNDSCQNSTDPYGCNDVNCNFAAIQACPYFAYSKGWNASGCTTPNPNNDSANKKFVTNLLIGVGATFGVLLIGGTLAVTLFSASGTATGASSTVSNAGYSRIPTTNNNSARGRGRGRRGGTNNR